MVCSRFLVRNGTKKSQNDQFSAISEIAGLGGCRAEFIAELIAASGVSLRVPHPVARYAQVLIRSFGPSSSTHDPAKVCNPHLEKSDRAPRGRIFGLLFHA
jgi:hypothetical protein